MVRIFFLLTLFFSASAMAQQPFDSVVVKRIKPADLPGPEESALPGVLRGAVLPKVPTTDQIDRMFAFTRSRTVEVVAEFPPVSSLQKTPLILSGQAVWLSGHPDGKNPVLVTPAHWVDGSRNIRIRAASPRENTRSLPTASVTNIRSVTLDARAQEILNSPDLKSAKVAHLDKHRNLAILQTDDLVAPETGLTFFPMQRQSPTYLYGVSPLLDSPRMATILQTDARKTEIVFYLVSDFPVSLGAVIVTPDAHIVAMTAMPHPEEQHLTLVIPPLAIQRFVESFQGISERPLEETVDDK